MTTTAKDKLTELQDLIGRLDQKASFMIAATALVIALKPAASAILFKVALCSGAIALLAAVHCIWPRTPLRGNDLSWVAMADQSESAIARHLEGSAADGASQVTATHLKTLALICRKKVFALRMSIVFLMITVVLMAVGQIHAA